MTEHFDITSLTHQKTQALGGFQFDGLEGSSSTSSVQKHAPKRRRFNDPTMRGAQGGGAGPNPLSLFNRVVKSDLNPPQVSFTLPETTVLKVKTSKKRNNESACQVNVSLQGMEFGGKSDRDYKDLVGHGQVLMVEAQYWKGGKITSGGDANSNYLMRNSQHSVFETGAAVDKQARSNPAKRAHGLPLSYINRFLRSGDKDMTGKFFLDAGKIELPETLSSRFRPLGVVTGVGSTHFNTEKHTTNQVFGLARGPPLLNYWLMCTPQPQAGVHLWFTLFRITRAPAPDGVVGAVGTHYFQFLPTTSLGHTPLPPAEVPADSSVHEQMKAYLLPRETITQSYQSMHIAKATNVALCKNIFHLKTILLYFTRLNASAQRPGLQELSKATLYLRDALLC